MTRTVPTQSLIEVFRVGSGEWTWQEEYQRLINQSDTQKLLTRIYEEGIREPILLGSDGRVWDGHHRISIAIHLGIAKVPVEFATEVPEPEYEYRWEIRETDTQDLYDWSDLWYSTRSDAYEDGMSTKGKSDSVSPELPPLTLSILRRVKAEEPETCT